MSSNSTMNIALMLAFLIHLAKTEIYRMVHDAHLIRTNDNMYPLYECNVKEHPYFISLHLGAISNVHCGGSLIAPTIVLTAAHCCVLYRTDTVIAVSGYGYHPGKYSQRSYMKGAYIHPNYKSWEPEKGNDVCLIRLNESISEDAYTKYVDLADPSLVDHLEKSKHIVRMMGFRWYPPEKDADRSYMHCSSLSVATWEECSRKIPGALHKFNFCLNNSNSTKICHIDEGGPILYKGLQVGIVSFTPNFVPDCTTKNYLLANKVKSETIGFVRQLDGNYSEMSKSRENVAAPLVRHCELLLLMFLAIILYKH